jgi:hypothetical protein
MFLTASHTTSPFNLKIFDWGIAKSIEFGLVEMVRFVPNQPLKAPKIAKLRHFYVIGIQENANVTSFRKNVFVTLKIEFHTTLRPGQNCNTSKKIFHLEIFM